MFKNRASLKKRKQVIRKPSSNDDDAPAPVSTPDQQHTVVTESEQTTMLVEHPCLGSGERQDKNEDDEDVSIQQRIEQVKKKRKLLASVQFKRGVDSAELIQFANQRRRNKKEQEDEDEDQQKESTAVTTDGILDQKHRKAMEDFIASKLHPKSNQYPEVNNTSSSSTKANSTQLTEDGLYSELAATAKQWSGKANTTLNNSETSKNDTAAVDDSDGGDGGVVLVAGTGIAEVILPVQERLQVEQETHKAKVARAISRKEQARKQEPVPNVPTAIPNRFAVSASTANHAHNNNPNYNRNNNPSTERDGRNDYYKRNDDQPPPPHPSVESSEGNNAADAGRLGFEALKRRHHARHNTNNQYQDRKPRNISNDHRVFQNFVTRQREMKK